MGRIGGYKETNQRNVFHRDPNLKYNWLVTDRYGWANFDESFVREVRMNDLEGNPPIDDVVKSSRDFHYTLSLLNRRLFASVQCIFIPTENKLKIYSLNNNESDTIRVTLRSYSLEECESLLEPILLGEELEVSKLNSKVK